MTQSSNSDRDLDVAVIGAGYAGSLMALKAAETGLRVGVFDMRAEYPDHFRAEKLEPDQHDALDRLGAMDLVRPLDSPYIDHVNVFTGRKRRVVACRKHRGMDYRDTVNSFRQALRARGLLQVRRIADLKDRDDHCSIVFDDGVALRARLGVVATGGSKLARSSLGLPNPDKEALTSTSFGFFVEPADQGGLRFEAFNALPDRFVEGLHYATFFPVGLRTRVNVFTCWRPAGREAREFRADPVGGMQELFPHLLGHCGAFRVSGGVQVFTTRYYRQPATHLKSVILAGDEFQSVSPATGMGISKCLTDVEAAMGLFTPLQAEPGRPPELERYFLNARKRRVDEDARRRWEWANETATSRSLRTRLRKLKRGLSARLSSAAVPASDAVSEHV